jgi:hypothetical protein
MISFVVLLSSNAALCSYSTRPLQRNHHCRGYENWKFHSSVLMFLVATAVSYVGYLPYNIIIFIKVLNPKAYSVIKSATRPFMAVLLRGYFLNNASNPVVYCFLDNRFRTECKMFYSRIRLYLCSRREKRFAI